MASTLLSGSLAAVYIGAYDFETILGEGYGQWQAQIAQADDRNNRRVVVNFGKKLAYHKVFRYHLVVFCKPSSNDVCDSNPNISLATK